MCQLIDTSKMRKINDGTNNGGNLFLDEGLLYKVYENNYCTKDKEQNLLLLKSAQFFPPKIMELFYDDTQVVAYSQEFIPNAVTFKEGINENLSYLRKAQIISDVFCKLRILHENNIYIGDVHSRNLVYNDEGGFIVDLDEIRTKESDRMKFTEYYYIRKDSSSPMMISSKYTDNIKLTISALSLLYNFDFEKIAKDGSLDRVKSYLGIFISNREFRQEVFEVFDNERKIIYFDQVLNKYNKGKVLLRRGEL